MPSSLRVFAGRIHDVVRNALWLHAHRLRRWWTPPPPRRSSHEVLHVTTSFDLGGTQRQIQHLVTSTAGRHEHRVTEIFPELNYLYRVGEVVDPKTYVRGGPIARSIGRAIVSRDRRGWHLVQIAKLVRDFRAARPRVVVAWGHEICVTTFAAATIARVPHVVFCIRTVNPARGWADDRFAELLRQAHRRMSPLVARVVVNSTFLRQDHAQWLDVAGDTIAVCPNGIAVEAPPPVERITVRQRMRDRFGINDDAIVIANIGRFSPEKGQLSLVAAHHHLPASLRSRIVWLLCGDGPTLEQVKTAAHAAEMHVVLPGRTESPWDTLAASDIFVMPSDFEGMPNAMMEAMTMALPCVSTTRSGIRDVAREGLEALYYEPGDTLALSRHLESLITKPSRAQALGAAAARRIAEFDVPRLVACFDALIDDLFEHTTHSRETGKAN